MNNNILIIIPARGGSTRLPRKPLKMIGDKTLIEHVYSRCNNFSNCEIVVATDDQEILKHVEDFGGKAVMTKSTHQSGTDRVKEAADLIDPEQKFQYVINVQGDLPFILPETIEALIKELPSSNFDILTPISEVKPEQIDSASCVSAAVTSSGQALYFSRSNIPHNAETYNYHIGLYGFKRAALNKFVSLPVSDLEKTESLEQLRALENNMTIGVVKAYEVPISVDTEQDLQDAIDYYNKAA